MNKKGFVLVETLVVTIFTMFIFTVLYNSVVPLLGKYKELSYYDDLDTTYELYYLKNMIMEDTNFSTIKENEYKKIRCSDLNNTKCVDLYNFLNIKESDSVLFINTDNIDIIQDDEDVSVDIKNYLKYIKTDNKEILLLEHDGYLSYIELVESLNLSGKIFDSVEDSVCDSSILEDGITYFSGTNGCVNFNYVWYSGKLWRITAIYPDGSMKLITENLMTSIVYGDNTTAFSNSYVKSWLTSVFLPTLYNYSNILVTNYKWNATTTTSLTNKLNETTMVSSQVGLLNTYELYKSYQKSSYTNSYLYTSHYWYLINPYNSKRVWSNTAAYYGTDYTASSYGDSEGAGYQAIAIRPCIVIKPGIELISGNGTKSNPYRIKGDISNPVFDSTKLNTRVSGEYVNFNNELYRIVSIDNSKTKLIKTDYVKDSSGNVVTRYLSSANSNANVYGEDSQTRGSSYWYYYLNNTWKQALVDKYENMLDIEKYYLGKSVKSYSSAKTSAFSRSDMYVGLPRYGEMFATQNKNATQDFWLLTPFNNWFTWGILKSGLAYNKYPSSDYDNNEYYYGKIAVRPTIYLKSSVKITGGSGLPDDPYEIS